MTEATQVSVYSQVFVPRDYDVFAGLDVDHHSIAATFTDHQRLKERLNRVRPERFSNQHAERASAQRPEAPAPGTSRTIKPKPPSGR